MMTRFKTYFNSPFVIILFSLILVIFSTCKKYPEGGFESRGPKVLLKHGGAWTLTLYEVNGVDSTDLINFNGNDKYKDIDFFKTTRYSSTLSLNLFPSLGHSVAFSEKNKNLSVVSNWPDSTRNCLANNFYSGCYKLFFTPEGKVTTWEIIKLTKKELILQTSLKKSYKLEFKCR